MTPRRATTERLRRILAASAFTALCGFSEAARPCGAFVSRESYLLKPCVEDRVRAAQFEESGAAAKFTLDVAFSLQPSGSK
jgi:hypothetical protein